MSEVANSILWYCEGCDRSFHLANGMLKSIPFTESKPNYADIKFLNLSKITDYVVYRLLYIGS